MLGHVIAYENSAVRLWLLRLYARHEVFILSVMYRIVKSPVMRRSLARQALFYTLAYPSARWGITGTPRAPAELESFFEGASRIAVGPCRCRTAHGACEHPLRTDIVVRTGFGVWRDVFDTDFEEITAAEALEICTDCHQQGMAQISYAHLDLGTGGSTFVMCNCCGDGCLPLLARSHYGEERYPFHKGIMRTYVETDRCGGCGECVSYCVFGARAIGPDSKARVEGCHGCGLCVSHCPSGAASYV